MSRHIFRLNCFSAKPILSWFGTPKVTSSLRALSLWLLHRQRVEVIDVQAARPSLLDAVGHEGHAADSLAHSSASSARDGTHPGACDRVLVPHTRTCTTPIPHLKVVLVRDARDPKAQAPARLVISGRMADVCAELDRLAA